MTFGEGAGGGRGGWKKTALLVSTLSLTNTLTVSRTEIPGQFWKNKNWNWFFLAVSRNFKWSYYINLLSNNLSPDSVLSVSILKRMYLILMQGLDEESRRSTYKNKWSGTTNWWWCQICLVEDREIETLYSKDIVSLNERNI